MEGKNIALVSVHSGSVASQPPKKQPMGAALLQPSSPPPPPSSSGSGSRYMASGSECGTAAVVHTAAVFDKKEEGRGPETTPRALFAGDIVKEEGREGRCFIDRL